MHFVTLHLTSVAVPKACKRKRHLVCDDVFGMIQRDSSYKVCTTYFRHSSRGLRNTQPVRESAIHELVCVRVGKMLNALGCCCLSLAAKLASGAALRLTSSAKLSRQCEHGQSISDCGLGDCGHYYLSS